MSEGDKRQIIQIYTGKLSKQKKWNIRKEERHEDV